MTTNKKITELAELTEANLSDDDVLAIVDVSAGTTNKVRKSTLASALAGVASLSATSPVTVSAGTGAVNIAVTTIPITSGGTGATTAADARTNLGVPASGDISDFVTGPASATDSALALFNGTTGKIIKDSTYTITAAGAALIDDASASAQRTTLGAAASGANTDITSLGGLTTDIAVADGGTGAGTAGAARTNLGAAASGANTDITSLAADIVISGSTSGDALRITQTGAGNALVVEDSSNPDSTPFIVDASGKVGVGTTAPFSPFNVQRNGTPSSGSASTVATFQSTSAASQSTYVSLIGGSTGSTAQAAIHFGDADDVDVGQILYRNSDDSMDFVANAASKMKIESDGRVKVVNAAYNPITTDNDLSFSQAASNNFKCTPSGSGTLTFTNHTAGQSGNVLLINSGGHAISLAATTKGDANLATTISTAGTYWLSYYDDGTNAYVVTSAVFA